MHKVIAKAYIGRNVRGQEPRHQERQHQDAIIRELFGTLPGYTLLEGTGYWENQSEETVIVTAFLAGESQRDAFDAICGQVAHELDQECVARTFTAAAVDFVSFGGPQ